MSENNLLNTAIIFGGTSSVGFEMVKTCARLGYNVLFTYHSSFEKVQTCIHELKSEFPSQTFEAVLFDALSEQDREISIDQIFGSHSNICSVIYNCSVFFYDFIEKVELKAIDASMDIHVKAPLLILKKFKEYVDVHNTVNASVIHMIDSRVVNLTPHFCSYTLGKASLWTLTQTAAREFAPSIRVNAIGLGPMTLGKNQTSQQFAKQIESLPLKKAPSFEDLAKALGCLLHCQSLTGQMLCLDSGASLGWQFPDEKEPRFWFA